MVKTKAELDKSIGRFVSRIGKKIHVIYVILFGSYAGGTPRPYSDIDIAVISPDFDKMREIDAMQFLSVQAKDTDILIEPISFPAKELRHLMKGSFLDYILKNGKIVYPMQKS